MDYSFGGFKPSIESVERSRQATSLQNLFPSSTSPPTPSAGTAPTSAGTPSAGSGSAQQVENTGTGLNKLTNVLSVTTASLNGLVQTVGGTDNAFANGVSNILGNITAVSSSFSVLEELTGQQIKSVGDFLSLNKNTGKSFAGIDDSGQAKDGSLAKLLEDKLGSKLGPAATQLTVGVGNMVGAFAQ